MAEFVIMVEAEEGEPLFWKNGDGWIGEAEDAQKYSQPQKWVPFYHTSYSSSYILIDEAVKIETEWKLKNSQ